MRSIRLRVCCGLLLVGCCAFLAVAQPTKTDVPAKKEAEPGFVEVRLADGSSVRMTLVDSHIEVTTRYGKLRVPVADIKRVDFGFRYPDGTEAKIADAVARLGATNFRQRETAMSELLAFRELAYPSLKRALQSTDPEVVKRAEELVKKIEDRVPAERLKMQDNDLVHTKEFTIAGRIESSTIKAKTPYFGEVSVALAEARSMRSLTGGGEVELAFDAKYASHSEWMETDIEISSDDPLEIKASGMMLMRPNQPNQGYDCTPNGNPNYREGMYGPGQLLARVGKNGKTFTVGEKYKGVPGESGRLYLRAHPSPWINQGIPMSGSYTVKIAAGSAVDGGNVRPPVTPKSPGPSDKEKGIGFEKAPAFPFPPK